MNENISKSNLLESKFFRCLLITLSVTALTFVLLIFGSIDTKALELKCNISTEGMATGNLSVANLPNGTNNFYSDQTANFNIAGDTDLKITQLSLTLYKNGSYYDHRNININNFIRFAAFPYSNLSAGSYSYKWDYIVNGGSSSSGTINFTVSDPTYIVSSPSNTTVKSGNTAYFSASASGGKSSLSYRWYYSDTSSGSGTLISGATSSSYSVTASSSNSGRYYYCRVTDGERSATTSRAKLTTAYLINYKGNGGTGTPSTQTKIHGSSITLSSTRPTRIGYSFLGWSTSSSTTSVSYSPGSTFSVNANTTLYAVWRSAYELYENSTNQISIKKDNPVLYYAFTPSVGGKYVIYSSVTEDTKVTLYNSNYTQLSTDDDSGDNKNFRLEYYLTSGQKYIFGLQYYNSDTEGTLKFTFGKVYTISYNANGGSGAPASQSKDYKKTLTLSSSKPTRIGYSFLGWSTSSSATSVSYSPGDNFTTNENTTLYAVWQNANSLYENSTNQVSIRKSNPISYYTFTPSTSGKYVIYSTVTQDTEVTLYDSNYVQLSKDDDSGDNRNFRLEYYLTAGQKYIFGLQYHNTNNEGILEFTFGKVYTITYNANGGSGAPASQSKDYEKTITLSSSKPTRSGYTFLGWSDTNNAKNPSFFAGGNYSYNANKTLYAVWDDVANPTCSITLTNNTSVSQTVTLYFSDNDGVSGYYWGKSANYKDNIFYSESYSDSRTVTEEGTYYIVVKDINGNLSNTYTIEFEKISLDAQGGNVSPNYIITSDRSTLSLPTPTRSGYTFVDWSLIDDNTYQAEWDKNSSPTPSKPTSKKSQTITAKSYTKVYGSKTFNLGAKAKTKLSYSSNNKGVVTVSSKGNITIKGVGKATITIKAQGTSTYQSATKKITINVNPKPVSKVSYSVIDNGTIKLKWDKVSKASFYEIVVSYNKTITSHYVWSDSIILKGLKKNTLIKIRAVTNTKDGDFFSSYKTLNVSPFIKVNPVNEKSIKYKKKGSNLYVSWSKVSGAKGYQVKVYATNKNGSSIGSKFVNKNTLTLKNASKGQKVKFSVRTCKLVNKKSQYSEWKTKTFIVR